MNSNLVDTTYNYVFEIELELENISPLRIGTGEAETVLLNGDKKSLVFGSSVCGAVKNYLMSVYEKEKIYNFFGNTQKIKNENDEEKEIHIDSKIYFSDMVSSEEMSGKIVERAGIRINNELGSTEEKGKYNTLFIGKNNKYKLNITAFINIEEAEELKQIMKSIVNGIDKKQILFGADKTKGFGVFKVKEAKYIEFDLRKEMESYLRKNILNAYEMKNFEYLEGKILKELEEISFQGKIKDSFLLKGEEKEETYKDSNRKDKSKKVQYSLEEVENKYIIPSGSIKGSMRAYMEKIVNTLKGEKIEHDLIKNLFGHNPDPDVNQGKYQIGKLIISDTEIKNTEKTEYHRIKIDRFTGGVINGALINEKRIVDGVINLKMQVRGSLEPQEKALILLYFRDLGLGKITLGSNASVGSGRIKGVNISFVDDVKVIFDKHGNLDMTKSKNIDEIDNWLKVLQEEVSA